MDNDADSIDVDDDYYAFLNLARDVSWNFDWPHTNFNAFRNLPHQFQATLEQINAAYKHLSRQFHPDKHTDPAKKKDADIIFNKIKTAHAVLSNPEDRQIYDLLGTKGLKTDGWQLLPRWNSTLRSNH